MHQADFSDLSPHMVVHTLEEAYGLALQGSISHLPSYVNRVWLVRGEDGLERVAKFYRPGRWSEAAIREEHAFLADCASAELPVVSPIPSTDGDTLARLQLETEPGITQEHYFMLMPKKAGRNFDAERQEDWFRLGSVCARLHTVAAMRPVEHRLVCTPAGSTARFLQELWDEGVVSRQQEAQFFDLAESMLDRIAPAFEDIPLQRIHGDLHRGNILDRGPEGLLLFDFDDMMCGPQVQDLWLLLPGYLDDCAQELTWLLEGYRQFQPFDQSQLRLIEPLRYMRMVYFLAWCARQRFDNGFRRQFPDWGSSQFWVKEIEDFRQQSDVLRSQGF